MWEKLFHPRSPLIPGRWRTHRTITNPALQHFYDTAQPALSTPIDEVPLLAVDVETTGLDPAKDRVLSIGWVPVQGNSIDLSGAGYCLICTEGAESVGESATIHGLTDDALDQGLSPKEAVTQLLEALAGRVMLAHYSAIEREFLSALCRKECGSGLRVGIVDTFELERRHMERMGTYPRGEDLRLPRVRQRYDLPYYAAHNALSDALSCAELFLAMRARNSAHSLRSYCV